MLHSSYPHLDFDSLWLDATDNRIEIPKMPDSRTFLREYILTLAENELHALGVHEKYIRPIRRALHTAMPDISDKNFASALQSRTWGIIEAIRMLLLLQELKRNSRQTTVDAFGLAEPYLVDGGREVALATLSLEARTRVFTDRLASLRQTGCEVLEKVNAGLEHANNCTVSPPVRNLLPSIRGRLATTALRLSSGSDTRLFDVMETRYRFERALRTGVPEPQLQAFRCELDQSKTLPGIYENPRELRCILKQLPPHTTITSLEQFAITGDLPSATL